MKSRQVLVVQVVHHGIFSILVGVSLADLAVDQAALDLVPVLGAVDPLLQPVRVIPELVLLVPFTGQGLPGALVGDHEGEDGEGEEEEDEEEHDEEVDPEEPGDAAARAHEARDGHHHEEHPERDDRLLEELLAVGVGTPGEPYAGPEDGDGEEERDEVEDADQVVAEAEHLLSESRLAGENQSDPMILWTRQRGKEAGWTRKEITENK